MGKPQLRLWSAQEQWRDTVWFHSKMRICTVTKRKSSFSKQRRIRRTAPSDNNWHSFSDRLHVDFQFLSVVSRKHRLGHIQTYSLFSVFRRLFVANLRLRLVNIHKAMIGMSGLSINTYLPRLSNSFQFDSSHPSSTVYSSLQERQEEACFFWGSSHGLELTDERKRNLFIDKRRAAVLGWTTSS